MNKHTLNSLFSRQIEPRLHLARTYVLSASRTVSDAIQIPTGTAPQWKRRIDLQQLQERLSDGGAKLHSFLQEGANLEGLKSRLGRLKDRRISRR